MLCKRSMQIKKYQIAISDIHLYAYHGVMPQEQQVGASYTIDILLTLTDYSCVYSDDITSTVSYADVYDLLKQEMSKPSQLLEHVCWRIIRVILDRFACVDEVEVALFKDTPPMGGDRLGAGVTIKGIRDDS